MIRLVCGVIASLAAVIACSSTPAAATTTRVGPGESLTEIAIRFHTSVSALTETNHIADPNLIEAGTILQIPAPLGTTAPAQIVVTRGDTLAQLALRFHTSVVALATANHIADPNQVAAGSILQIPSLGSLPKGLLVHPERLSLEPVFRRWAIAFGVRTDLLEAICWWESGWQNSVVSSTQAIGVGQLEPETIALMRIQLGNSALDPHVASDNIEMAAAYLRDLLTSEGNVRLALAAYYQGVKSIRLHGEFQSTRHYVQGIVASIASF